MNINGINGFTQLGKVSKNGTRTFVRHEGAYFEKLIGLDKDNCLISDIGRYLYNGKPITVRSKFFSPSGKLKYESAKSFTSNNIIKVASKYEENGYGVPCEVQKTVVDLSDRSNITVNKTSL